MNGKAAKEEGEKMENQRVRLTKQMLKNGLIDLLKEKRLDKITIYELCEKAQVNRTTFYRYYGNQYDLMDEIQEEFYQSLEGAMSQERPGGVESLTDILAYVDEHRELAKTLIHTLSDEKFLYNIISRPMIAMELDNSLSNYYEGWRKEYISIFLYQGVYSIIRKWINQEDQRAPQEIAELIVDIMSKYMKA